MKPQRLLLSTKFTPLNEWGDDRKGSLSVFPTRAGAPRSVDSVIVSRVEGITFYIRHRSIGTTLAACGNPGRDSLEILNEGVARLRKRGFDPMAKLVRGQPAEEIGTFARQIGADLIVVGHRRQSAFDRWWSGPKGAYLMDYTDCSLPVARNLVSDEAIEAALFTSGQTKD
jgi:nucleotide-binding universal stress UspA family protein